MASQSKHTIAAPLTDQECASAKRVGERLKSELELLIRSLPPQFRGTTAMSRELGIDRSTCQRVMRAARNSTEPLDVLAQVPGAKGLLRFTDALTMRGIPQQKITPVTEAFEAFHRLIDDLADSQSALIRRIEALTEPVYDNSARSLVRGRPKNELREQAFEVISELTERRLELQCNYLFARPLPDNPRKVELVGARDLKGMEGSKGASPVSAFSFYQDPNTQVHAPTQTQPLYTEDKPNTEHGRFSVIEEFCSEDHPPIEIRQAGDIMIELIEPPGEDAAPIDMAVGYRIAPPIQHVALQEDKRLFFRSTCPIPTRRLMMHVYLHKSMARQCLVEAFVYERGVESLSDARSPWFDRMDQPLVVEILSNRLAADETPIGKRQRALQAHVFEQAGWDPSDFVGYRTVVDHPLWGCRYAMVFDFSDSPQES